MDRVVSVGCKSWLWVCHVMRRLPDPSIERNSRRFMLGLPHTGDRMGSSLRLGSDQSSWLTRAEVAVGSKSAPDRASAASLVPLWRHSRKAGGGNDLNDVRFLGVKRTSSTPRRQVRCPLMTQSGQTRGADWPCSHHLYRNVPVPP